MGRTERKDRMSDDINTVIVSGKVQQDVRMHTFDNGTGKASFNIACVSTFKEKEFKQFFSCVAFGEPSKACSSLAAGDLVIVSGSLGADKRTDKADPSKTTYVTIIKVQKVQRIAPEEQVEVPPAGKKPEDDETMPF